MRRQGLYQVARRLTHPGRALQQRMQRLDDVERQLIAATQARIGRARNVATLLRHAAAPVPSAARDRARARRAAARRAFAGARRQGAGRSGARSARAAVSRALNAVSPLATLGRGYAIVTTPAPLSERWGTPIISIAAYARAARRSWRTSTTAR